MSTNIPFVIAIVDDDPSVLEALGNLFESMGYGVRRFHSAEQLLRGTEVYGVHCVISDIGMPDKSGVTLQHELGQLRPELPVILITGRNGWGNVTINAANNRGFFRKPFDSQKLLDAVAAALAGSERQ
jgi:FixJ family two-component response regulator